MNEMNRNKWMKGVDFSLFCPPIPFLPSPFSFLSLLMINTVAWDNAFCINQREAVFLDCVIDKTKKFVFLHFLPSLLHFPSLLTITFTLSKVCCSIYLLSVYRLILNIEHRELTCMVLWLDNCCSLQNWVGIRSIKRRCILDILYKWNNTLHCFLYLASFIWK